jgi:hypothetical protein
MRLALLLLGLWLPHDNVSVVARSVDPNAISVNTPAWVCIRKNESTNGRLSSNIYQFQNGALMGEIGMVRPPGTYTRAQQNEFALKAYAVDEKYWHDGFHAWAADYNVCHLS